MKASELREKSIDELKNELLASLRELFNLRMQRGMGQMSNPNMFKKAKLTIARIKTILRQKGCRV